MSDLGQDPLQWTAHAKASSHVSSVRSVIPLVVVSIYATYHEDHCRPAQQPQENLNACREWVESSIAQEKDLSRINGHFLFRSIQSIILKETLTTHGTAEGDLRSLIQAWWWLLTDEERNQWSIFARRIASGNLDCLHGRDPLIDIA